MTPPTAGDCNHSRSSAATLVPRKSIIKGPSDTAFLELPSSDVHHCSYRDELEQLGDVAVRHADTADRSRHTHRLRIRRAMDVNVAAHCIDGAEPIPADFGSGEPQNARQYPVAVRLGALKLGRVDLARRPSAAKHGVQRRAGPDLRAHDVAAARRLEAAEELAGAVL